MSKFKTEVKYVVTQEAVGKKLEMGYLYLKNVPVSYAKVHEPAKKLNSDDKAYQLNVFIDADSMEAIDTLGVNKNFAEVGVTKITKGVNRGKLKYPVKDAEGNDTANTPYAGMFACQFSRETVKRDPKTNEIVKTYEPLKVVYPDGELFTADIGNGSICTVKIFCYRNSENMLNTMMDTVVVLDHVEYIKAGGDGYDAELGLTVKSAPKAPAIDPELQSNSGEVSAPAKPKAAPKAAPVVEEELDDIPF